MVALTLEELKREIREQYYEPHLPLIDKVLGERRFRWMARPEHRETRLEARQDAAVAMIEALAKHDPGRGPCEPFLKRLIRQTVALSVRVVALEVTTRSDMGGASAGKRDPGAKLETSMLTLRDAIAYVPADDSKIIMADRERGKRRGIRGGDVGSLADPHDRADNKIEPARINRDVRRWVREMLPMGQLRPMEQRIFLTLARAGRLPVRKGDLAFVADKLGVKAATVRKVWSRFEADMRESFGVVKAK
jgi:hypothetical protein